MAILHVDIIQSVEAWREERKRERTEALRQLRSLSTVRMRLEREYQEAYAAWDISKMRRARNELEIIKQRERVLWRG